MSHHTHVPSGRLTPTRDVVARRLGDTSVLVHLGNGAIVELNETGSRVWELLADGTPLDGIADVLVREFETTREEAAVTTATFLGQLRDAGMIE